MPKVSVMILTYQRPELLKKAVLSVANQSFKDYEIIIGDNNSQDGTGVAIRELIAGGLPIKHLFHNPAVSITENRQRVLKACQGEYVAPLDDDDTWSDSEKLQKQVTFMDSRPEVVLLGGGIQRVDDAGRKIDIKFRPETDAQIRRSMLIQNNFFTSTVIFRLSAAHKVGGFMFLDNDYAEDYYFWLRMGRAGKLHNLQEVCTNYRIANYPKAKLLGFYAKQKKYISMFKGLYPNAWLADLLINLRVLKSKLL
jgi:glycosyltransferase involved in cell wall biosynthesis